MAGEAGQVPDRGEGVVDRRAIRVTLTGVSGDVGLDPCVVEPVGDDGEIHIDGRPTTDRLRRLDPERAVLAVGGGEAHRVLMLPPRADPLGDRSIQRREMVVDGWRVELELESEARIALRARARRGRTEGIRSGPIEVRAMIPGVVLAVSVVEGDRVAAGQQLALVEAMKMQNEVRAPRDGSIERVSVAAGSKIEVGDLLLVIA